MYLSLASCVFLAVFTSRVQNKADRLRLQVLRIVSMIIEQLGPDLTSSGTIKLDLTCYECTNEEGGNPWQFDKDGNPQENNQPLSSQARVEAEHPASFPKRKGQNIYCVMPKISLGEKEQYTIMEPSHAEGIEVFKGTDFQVTLQLSATAKFKIGTPGSKGCLSHLVSYLNPCSSPFPVGVQIFDEEVKVEFTLGGHGFTADLCKICAALRSPKEAINDVKKKIENVAKNAISSQTINFENLEENVKTAVKKATSPYTWFRGSEGKAEDCRKGCNLTHRNFQ